MNIELAMAALEDAKAHPENFDMDSFFSFLPKGGIVKTGAAIPPLCGTTACYAGFASLRYAPIGAKVVSMEYGIARVVIPGAEPVDVEDYATKALEISDSQAGVLFYLEDIGQVETAVRHLVNHPDASGADLWDLFLDEDEASE